MWLALGLTDLITNPMQYQAYKKYCLPASRSYFLDRSGLDLEQRTGVAGRSIRPAGFHGEFGPQNWCGSTGP